MRFELTHHDLAMLTRYAIVGETYSASHHHCSTARGTEHVKFIKLYYFDTMQATDVCWCLVETVFQSDLCLFIS